MLCLQETWFYKEYCRDRTPPDCSTWSPPCCLQGFYIVSYALGIYNLNLLLGFLTPQIDPEMEGPTLPNKGSDEFRPFVRRLPEFKFW